MKEKVTLREYLKAIRILEEDKDICVDGIDDACIAYCGTELTPEGEEHFKEALELEVEEGTVISDRDEDYDLAEDQEGRLYLAWELLYGAAGYCSCSDFDKWFKA